jgi:hypothetical protein
MAAPFGVSFLPSPQPSPQAPTGQGGAGNTSLQDVIRLLSVMLPAQGGGAPGGMPPAGMMGAPPGGPGGPGGIDIQALLRLLAQARGGGMGGPPGMPGPPGMGGPMMPPMMGGGGRPGPGGY